jgi:hypothetical protein
VRGSDAICVVQKNDESGNTETRSRAASKAERKDAYVFIYLRSIEGQIETIPKDLFHFGVCGPFRSRCSVGILIVIWGRVLA